MLKYNVLVIGNGGREHAIIKSLLRSPKLNQLFCSYGNGGIASDAICIDLANASEIINFCKQQNIELVIIGPEQPLVDGVSDELREAGIRTFAPSKAAAEVEASKAFTKSICDAANIPTASYGKFTDVDSALNYIKNETLPIVIKADGLAAGKGVIIAETMVEAQQTIKEMFAGKFGDASKTIVIEEFLDGEELSFFAICDGKKAVAFGSAQDHKRAYDGDKGPNTGGMGTYSPAPILNDELQDKIMQQIIQPAVDELDKRSIPYSGILFAGLMIKNNQPKLIEFNARLGDPETQVILTRLQDDFLTLCFNAANGELPSSSPKFTNDSALCVVMAAKGYPDAYAKGSVIEGLEEAAALPNVIIYHAGTKLEDSQIKANGGRVLGITATGTTLQQAAKFAYDAVKTIKWEDGFYRSDIGWRALNN
jgi:phosphoribosylamine--glycine ligase